MHSTNSTVSNSDQLDQPASAGFFIACVFGAGTGVNAIGGWAGWAKPTRHSVGEREAESARAARGGTGVTAVAEHGANVLSDSTFLLSKGYVPHVPQNRAFVPTNGTAKTRMDPSFFILFFINVPMFTKNIYTLPNHVCNNVTRFPILPTSVVTKGGLASLFSRNSGTKCKTTLKCRMFTGNQLCFIFWNILNKSPHSWNKAHKKAHRSGRMKQ